MSPDDRDFLIKDEVEKRLDALFGEDDEPDTIPIYKKPSRDKKAHGTGPELEYEETLEIADTKEIPESKDFEDTQEIETDHPGGGKHEPIPIKEYEGVGFDEPSSLRDLKAVILSIDWEINDETMNNLVDQVETLKDTYREDSIIVMFLRLLGSVGKYIKKNKANAHPGAIKLLSTVYDNLENVVLDEDMTDRERERVLLGEVEAFKKLKDEIAQRRAELKRKKQAERLSAGEEEKGVRVPYQMEQPTEIFKAPAELEKEGMLPHEAFSFAVEEIKEVIKAEFKALRAELKLWRKSK